MPEVPRPDPRPGPGRPAAAAAPVSVPPVIAPAAFPSIDGFRIEGPLGAPSGMGDVFRAVDVNLGRPVAIKLLKAAVDGHEARGRFFREARVLAALSDHPNIVNIHTLGITPGGQPYLVMAFVNGRTLDDWLWDRWLAPGDPPSDDADRFPRQDPDPDVPVRLFAKVCAAVGAAHDAGVIHRDLKPQNVMVDRRGEPQLLDFGIAQLLAGVAGSTSSITLTPSGGLPCTPLYASPEQASFRRDRMGATSDVYSLGVILYQMLTGGLYPYREAVATEEDPWVVLDIVRRCELVPPRERLAAARAAGLRPPVVPLPALDGELEAVVLRAMGREPADRYADADALGRAVTRWADRPRAGGGSPRPPAAVATPATVVSAAVAPGPAAPARRPAAASPAAVGPAAVGQVARRPAARPAPPRELQNSIGLTLVRVEPGTFVMGSPAGEEGRIANETPHEVTLTRPFYLAATQVSQAQWKAVMGTADDPSRFKGEDLPIEWVSWDEAVEFCRLLGEREGERYRLPTEAEWEYACRAGTTTPFNTGPTIGPDLANYDGNYSYGAGAKGVSRKKTTPAGDFRPNAWGLHDMHGNLGEWCNDWYAEYPPGAARDPAGPDKGKTRVVRGGSWINFPRACRSAFRSHDAPGTRNNRVGFRVVLDVE